MPIALNCSNCQAKLRVPDEAAGKKAKCARCGALNDVPTPVDAEPADLEPIVLDVDEQPSRPPAPAQRRRDERDDDDDDRPRGRRDERDYDDDDRPRRRRDERDDDDDRPRRRTSNRFSAIDYGQKPDTPWQPLVNGIRRMEVGVLGLIVASALILFGDQLVTAKDPDDKLSQTIYVLSAAMVLMVMGFVLIAMGRFNSRARPNPLVGRLTEFSFGFSAMAALFAFIAFAVVIYIVLDATEAGPAKKKPEQVFRIGTLAVFMAALFYYVSESLFLLAVQRAAAGRATPISVGAIILLVLAILCSILCLIGTMLLLANLIGGSAPGRIERQATGRSEGVSNDIILIVQLVIFAGYVLVLESTRQLVRSGDIDDERD